MLQAEGLGNCTTGWRAQVDATWGPTLPPHPQGAVLALAKMAVAGFTLIAPGYLDIFEWI